MSDSNENVSKKAVSRRNVLKWSGALAAAGVIGVGLGFGGDLLIRPNTTNTSTATAVSTVSATQTVTGPGTTSTQTVTGPGTTSTQTATTTVTAPPATISHLPPLDVQDTSTVAGIFKTLDARHQGETIVKNGCNYCGGHPCITMVHVKNGAITAVETDQTYQPNVPIEDQNTTDNDILHWNFNCRTSCPVAYTLPASNADPNRIIYPMLNVGTKGLGAQFVRTTWDNAVSTIASKMSYYKTTYGPYSIISGPYSAGGNVFTRLLGLYNVGIAGWGACSNDAGRIGNIFMINGADSPTPSSDAANVILGSKLIVMVGYRPSGTFKNAVPYAFTLAKKKGIPIICIDPVYTPDAEVFADQWIPIIPGTDTAFFTAVANYIIHNNLYNQTFINTYTYGFQQWANYVTGVTAGPDGVALDRTPAWAAPICGIPAATIIAFAQLYAKSNPTYLKWHYGSWRKSMGEEAPRTQMSLQAIMGYIGVLGGNTGNWESCEPSPASISVSLGAAATYHTPLMFRQHQWAKMINLVPKVKAGTLSASDYKRTIGWQEVDVGTGATNYPLPTPMMAMGSAGQMTGATNSMFEGATALQSLQYFVYATYFMHPSAYYADILLPRIDPALEGYSVCGTQGSGQNSLMGEWWYSNKAVPAPGQCKPDEWYCTQIANALSLTNYNQYYTDGIDADPNLADWDTMMVSRLQASYTTFAATMAKNVGNGPNAPAMIVPTWQQFVAGANIKLSDWNTVPWVGLQPSTFPIKTSTGKINILIDFFNTTSYPAADGQAVIDALPSYGRNYPAVPGYIQQVRGWYDSLTTKYPLVLLSTHSRYRDHSAFFNNPMLRPEVYQHHVWISATDAIARGISDGDNVTVVNDKGTIVLPAYVTARISPGVTIIRHGGWFKAAAPNVDIGGCPNSLMGEGEYTNGVVNDPTISPVTPGKATTLVQVQDAEYL